VYGRKIKGSLLVNPLAGNSIRQIASQLFLKEYQSFLTLVNIDFNLLQYQNSIFNKNYL